MITPSYCQTMARYNTWQNRAIAQAMEQLDEDAIRQERGAFFGSILGTCNHLLWGDRMWMSRFTDDVAAPEVGIRDSSGLTPTSAAWFAERYRLDGRIELWAERLRSVDLAGDLTWHSGATGTTMSRPIGQLVVHMFNHQTHHRGQIHAMLTAAGARTDDTDLMLMPPEVA